MDREESFISVRDPVESSISPDDDEDSFVVLETTSISGNAHSYSSKEEVLPPLRTNKVQEMQSLIKMKISQLNPELMPEPPAAPNALDTVISSVSKITISPDSSYEEIQKQVEELIKENETLKNIIAQNNMSMKTQYDRFLGYKDEVTSVMKSYRDKFNEAKVCMDKLKEENAKLVSDVEVYINIKKLHEEEIINLKDKNRELEISHCLDPRSGPNESVSHKFNELQTALAESGLKNTELLAENEKLKKEVAAIPKLQEEIEKFTAKLVFTPKIEEELEVKQQEIEKLQAEVEAMQKHKTDSAKLDKKIAELETEVSQSKQCQEEQNSRLYKLTEDNKVLRFKLLDNISKEQAQSGFEDQLKAKNSEIVILEADLERAKFTEFELSQQVKNLRTLLHSLQHKNPQTEEDVVMVRKQLCTAQQTITAMEQERDCKIKEVEELRKLLQDTGAKSDEIFALKEQLDIYKSDFEAEKKSKTDVQREKDQIAEDLQNLQKRNKQLQNEIETLRARNQPKPDGYTCPKCAFGFNTYQSLENHVHRCLDLDGFP